MASVRAGSRKKVRTLEHILSPKKLGNSPLLRIHWAYHAGSHSNDWIKFRDIIGKNMPSICIILLKPRLRNIPALSSRKSIDFFSPPFTLFFSIVRFLREKRGKCSGVLS
ncbi:hypothetical protein NPIL_104881 [Nephila pilipes]|uniref:Uncharacterized protein n=1 Tax=Nephila pilipes TaxID=299642 RepID=A0A8X6R0E6_NEPPI|nr:hypothetical protein NPIL_104881 [Nephila pilipes]